MDFGRAHSTFVVAVRLPIAAVVVATLTVAIAEAPAASSSPRSPIPGFLLDRGRYIPFEAPDPQVRIVPIGINNRGEIVGEYIRPEKRVRHAARQARHDHELRRPGRPRDRGGSTSTIAARSSAPTAKTRRS